MIKNFTFLNYRLKFLFLVLFMVFPKAQAVIYQEDFEGFTNGFLSTTTTNGWTADINVSCNYSNAWSVFDSGGYNINRKSLMISARSNTCAIYKGQYYTDLPVDRYVNTSVNSIGYVNLVLDFDWRGLGEVRYNGKYAYDYGSVVYMIGNSGTWIELSTGGYSNGIYVNRSGVTHKTINLPPELYDTQFQIGFKWHNDNVAGGYPAFVIDNLKITGCKLPNKPTITAPTVCVGSQLNPAAPIVLETTKGWQMESGVGTGVFSNITFPVTASMAH